MVKKLVGNYFLNASNFFIVVILQIYVLVVVFFKYMELFHIQYISQTIYIFVYFLIFNFYFFR